MADNKPTADEPASRKPKVIAKWTGDEGRFITGVPNRDITEDDGLSDELLKATLKAGLHERTDK